MAYPWNAGDQLTAADLNAAFALIVNAGTKTFAADSMFAFNQGDAANLLQNGTIIKGNSVGGTETDSGQGPTSSGGYMNVGWLDSTHVVVTYCPGTTGYAIVGLLANGSITWGTPYQFVSSNANTNYGSFYGCAILDSTHFATGGYGSWVDAGNSVGWYQEVFSVSGTTITSVAISSYTTSGSSANHILVGLDATHWVGLEWAYTDANTCTHSCVFSYSGASVSQGSFVVTHSQGTFSAPSNVYPVPVKISSSAYAIGDNNGIKVCTVSGTTITAGSASATPGTFNRATVLDSTHIALAYASSGAKAIVYSISGTTITPGSAVTIDGSGTVPIAPIMLDSTHFAVAYKNGAVKAATCSVSGTTITNGAAVTVDSSNVSPSLGVALSSTSFLVAYANGSNTTAVLSTTAGTVTTAGSPFTVQTGNNAPVVISKVDSTHAVFAYNSTKWRECVASAIVGYAGVVSAAVVAGATATVLSTGHAPYYSGLTIGSKYYIQTNGTVSTNSTSNLVGVAVATDTILLASNPPSGQIF